MGCIYALVGLGFILIYNATNGLNFAQGELVMLSAFVFYAMLSAGAPYMAAALLTIAVDGGRRLRVPAVAVLSAARPFISRLHHRHDRFFHHGAQFRTAGLGTKPAARAVVFFCHTRSRSATSSWRRSICSSSASPPSCSLLQYALFFYTDLGRRLRAAAQNGEVAH